MEPMKQYKLNDGDYWDGELDLFVVYIDGDQSDKIYTDLEIIDKHSGPAAWRCYLTKVIYDNCANAYRCLYAKYGG